MNATLTLPALGGAGSLATNKAIVVDTTAPGITLSSAAPDPTNAAITVSVTLGESSTNFVAGDVSTTNASVSNFAGSGSSYSFTLTASSQGSFSCNVTASKFTDAAGNQNTASNTLSRTFDSVAPGITLSSGAADPTNGAIAVSATLGESSINFDSGDISTTNAAVSNFSGSGTSYSWTLTASGQGSFSCNVTGSKFTDAAGNQNTASNTISRTFDNVAPGITLASVAPDPTNAAISVTVTLGESSTTFASGDVGTTNASVSNFAGSGTSYSFTLTPSAQGSFSCNVAAGAFTDAAGNQSTVSNTLSRTFDSVAPGITLASVAPDPTNAAIAVTVTLDESSTNFVSGDVSTTNANVSGFSGSGTSYSFTLTASGQGSFSCNVTGSKFTDAAGNQNTASNTISRTFDSVAPGITLSSAAGDPVSGAISVSATLGESSTNFVSGDISTANGSVSGFSGSGTSYSWTLTPTAPGLFSCNVTASKFTDAAGNQNTASNTVSRTFVPPAAEIAVFDGATPIADGETVPVDFGTVVVGSTAPTKTFTVGNQGTATLSTSAPALPAGYVLGEGLSSSIAASASDTFTVSLATATAGTFSGEISIANGDADENPYNFAVTGTVLLLGDADGNGTVTAADAQAAFDCFLAGGCAGGVDPLLADIYPDDGDGCVDIDDGNGAVTPGDAQRIFELFLGVQTLCP